MTLSPFTDGVTPLDAATFNPIVTAVNNAVPNWQPSTPYTVGTFVLDPLGNTVQCNTAHTSGSSFTAAYWTPVNDYGYCFLGFTSPSDSNSNGFEKMSVLTSFDGHSFTGAPVNPIYSDPNTGTSFRDPSVIKIGSTWFCAYTVNNGNSKNFGIIKSTDLLHWTSLSGVANTPTLVDVSAATSLNQCWAPELVADASGQVYAFWANVTSGGGQSLWYTKFTDNSGLTTWNAPAAASWTSAPAYAIDPSFIYDTANSLWRMFYGNSGNIERAYSSTLTGTWTVDKTGDWAGWIANNPRANSHLEAPEPIRTANGRYRIYFDTYNGTGAPYTHQGYQYSESSDLTTWTTPAECLKGPGMPLTQSLRHGAFWRVLNQTDRNMVNSLVAERAPVRHAEFTCSASLTGGVTGNIGTLTIDSGNSFNAGDFVTAGPSQSVTITQDGIYDIDWFGIFSTGCGGGFMAIKGPSSTPNLASQDLVSSAAAWSCTATNLHLTAGQVLQFYITTTNTLTLTGRVRISKQA